MLAGFLWFAQLFFLHSPGILSRNGITHSGLGPPESVSSYENAPQTWHLAIKLMETII